jgi:hypothetical protein
MRDIIVTGFMIAAVIILFRIILGSPLVTRVRESFANTDGVAGTGCPAGMTFAMHDGKAFCHIGDHATFVRSLSRGDKDNTFCALGPGTANCSKFVLDAMQKTASLVCPKDKPNYVKGPAGERCCAGPTNANRTECMGSNFCAVSNSGNEFADDKNCQFQKAQQSVACPAGYRSFVSQGDLGMKLLGCTNGAANCYATSTLQRLRNLGYDTTGLPPCNA